MSYAIYFTEEQLNSLDDIIIWCPACGENLGELYSDEIKEIREKGSLLTECFECGQSFYIETDD